MTDLQTLPRPQNLYRTPPAARVGRELDVQVTTGTALYLVVKVPLCHREPGAPFMQEHGEGLALADRIVSLLPKGALRDARVVIGQAAEMVPMDDVPDAGGCREPDNPHCACAICQLVPAE